MNEFILNREEFLKINDESFDAGSLAILEILDSSFNNWKYRLLFMIAPKFMLSKLKKSIQKHSL